MLRSFLIFQGEEANCTFRFISDVEKIQLEMRITNPFGKDKAEHKLIWMTLF